MGTIECEKIESHGELSATSSSTITLTPTAFTGCTWFGMTATIDINSCRYVFHINGGTSTTGTIDVACSGSDEIVITLGLPSTPKCTVRFPAQSGLSTVTYSNIGTGTTRELVFGLAINGLTSNSISGSGLGACKAQHDTASKFDGAIAVTAETVIKPTHVGLWAA